MNETTSTEKRKHSIAHARFMVESLTESAQWVKHPANGVTISDVDKAVTAKLLREWREHLDILLNEALTSSPTATI